MLNDKEFTVITHPLPLQGSQVSKQTFLSKITDPTQTYFGIIYRPFTDLVMDEILTFFQFLK